MRIIRDNILPQLNWKEDPKRALAQLQSALPPLYRHRANYAVINVLLNENEIRLAYEIAASDITVLDELAEPLIQAYHNTRDMEYLVPFIRLMSDGILRLRLTKEDAVVKQNEFIENVIESIVLEENATADRNVAFLSALFECGFFISNHFAKNLIQQLRADHETAQLLTRLAKQADDLKSHLQIFPGDYETMSSDQIVNALKMQKNFSQQTKLCQSNLIRAYVREGDEKGIQSFLSNESFELNSALYALLIDFYIKRRDFEKAIKWLKHAYKNDDNFVTGAPRSVKVIKLLTKYVQTTQDVDIFYVDEDNNADVDNENNARLFFFEAIFLEQINVYHLFK